MGATDTHSLVQSMLEKLKITSEETTAHSATPSMDGLYAINNKLEGHNLRYSNGDEILDLGSPELGVRTSTPTDELGDSPTIVPRWNRRPVFPQANPLCTPPTMDSDSDAAETAEDLNEDCLPLQFLGMTNHACASHDTTSQEPTHQVGGSLLLQSHSTGVFDANFQSVETGSITKPEVRSTSEDLLPQSSVDPVCPPTVSLDISERMYNEKTDISQNECLGNQFEALGEFVPTLDIEEDLPSHSVKKRRWIDRKTERWTQRLRDRWKEKQVSMKKQKNSYDFSPHAGFKEKKALMHEGKAQIIHYHTQQVDRGDMTFHIPEEEDTTCHVTQANESHSLELESGSIRHHTMSISDFQFTFTPINLMEEIFVGEEWSRFLRKAESPVLTDAGRLPNLEKVQQTVIQGDLRGSNNGETSEELSSADESTSEDLPIGSKPKSDIFDVSYESRMDSEEQILHISHERVFLKTCVWNHFEAEGILHKRDELQKERAEGLEMDIASSELQEDEQGSQDEVQIIPLYPPQCQMPPGSLLQTDYVQDGDCPSPYTEVRKRKMNNSTEDTRRVWFAEDLVTSIPCESYWDSYEEDESIVEPPSPGWMASLKKRKLKRKLKY